MVDMTVSLSVRFRRTDSVPNAGWYTASPTKRFAAASASSVKTVWKRYIKASGKQCPFSPCNATEISSFFDKACVQWLGNYKVSCSNAKGVSGRGSCLI